MSRPFGDDDIYDRPEYLDDYLRELDEYAERNVERADERANEKHDIADLF